MNKDENKNILYISYDGMTDPLGQSQVLPYIIGLAKMGYRFTLISCEKKGRFEKERDEIMGLCEENGIEWYPLPFTSFPPFLSKWLDLRRIKNLAFKLHKEKKFLMAHCRSYIAAEVGLKLKRTFGTKFFFDTRGFWVDERVDGGLWNLKNPFFRYLYHVYKKKEQDYIRMADCIVTLTEAAKTEIERWPAYEGTPIVVIPCSADFGLFRVADKAEQHVAKERLNVFDAHPIVGYLGSVGTWYLLDEMLLFFKLLIQKYPKAHFLFLTAESPDFILQKAKRIGVPEKSISICFAPRREVPDFLSACDFSLSFIKPAYSKIASSPTKLGELLAMGIPVITNGNVGDVEWIIKNMEAGVVINDFSIETLQLAINDVVSLFDMDRGALRQRAAGYYNLEDALINYKNAYKSTIK